MAGFWYPFVMVVLSVIVAVLGMPETAGTKLNESEAG